LRPHASLASFCANGTKSCQSGSEKQWLWLARAP
jgi:hypothetical protein